MPSPEQQGSRHWFEDFADHMGPAYLRYSFTKGTEAEVDFLVAQLEMEPGMRVLDVGCGPGRHAHSLARRGFEVVGVDIAERFIELATESAAASDLSGASFERADARALPFDTEFDRVVSLCQGGFGLGGPAADDSGAAADPFNLVPDGAVLDGIRRALRPGGLVGLSAFSSYFQVRYLEDHDSFDAATAINHERTELLDEDRNAIDADLWTTCYTPRELAMMCDRVGLTVRSIGSVTPGRYSVSAPDTDQPEFLLIAERPSTTVSD